MSAHPVKKAIHVAVAEVEEHEPVKPPVHTPVEPPPPPPAAPIVEPEPVVEEQAVVEAPVENEVVVEPVASVEPAVPLRVADEPEIYENKSHSFKWLIVLLAFIFGVVVGGAGLRFATYYLDKPTEKDDATVVTGPTATPGVTEPTPTVVPARGDLKVKVLNGSGQPGAAAAAAEVLETLGYVVSDTGNADKTDYAKTVVSVRSGKKALGEQLVADLKKSYDVEDVEEVTDLETGIDALVIVGKK